jgi:beta-glucanase (GH16 family)
MDNWKGKEITSASLHTYGKKSMLYGKIEVRAKLPTGKGTWPAIWMLGNSIREGSGWPQCGEIDIMENVGYNPRVIHANIHTKG